MIVGMEKIDNGLHIHGLGLEGKNERREPGSECGQREEGKGKGGDKISSKPSSGRPGGEPVLLLPSNQKNSKERSQRKACPECKAVIRQPFPGASEKETWQGCRSAEPKK